MVIFIVVAVFTLSRIVLQLVLKWTASSILARVGLVEHAHSLLWLLSHAFKVLLNQDVIVVIIFLSPVHEVIHSSVLEFACSNGLDDIDLIALVIEYDFLTYLSFCQLIIIFKVLRIVVLLLQLVWHALSTHHW